MFLSEIWWGKIWCNIQKIHQRSCWEKLMNGLSDDIFYESPVKEKHLSRADDSGPVTIIIVWRRTTTKSIKAMSTSLGFHCMDWLHSGRVGSWTSRSSWGEICCFHIIRKALWFRLHYRLGMYSIINQHMSWKLDVKHLKKIQSLFADTMRDSQHITILLPPGCLYVLS